LSAVEKFQILSLWMQIGNAGLRDQVNNHFVKIIGALLAVSAIGRVS